MTLFKYLYIKLYVVRKGVTSPDFPWSPTSRDGHAFVEL